MKMKPDRKKDVAKLLFFLIKEKIKKENLVNSCVLTSSQNFSK